MKKPGKWEINSNRIMKNEELITLRGGSDPATGIHCQDNDSKELGCINHLIECPTEEEALTVCKAIWKDSVKAERTCFVECPYS